MATTTRILDANVNGTVYTANANDALEALDTCHSGATAPTDEVANGKLWLDTSTTPGILKIYNNATWEVVHSGTVDINGGAIDGTTIGATTPAAVTTSSLVATTADINGGTIDGTVIGGSTPAAVTGTTLTATGAFTSLGIDDNAAATAVTIDASGNVGIGTAAPAYALDVASPVIQFGEATDALVQYDGSNGIWHSGTDVSGSFVFKTGAYGAGVEKMQITSTGNVGIGYAPSYKLDVLSSVIQFGESTDAFVQYKSTSGNWHVGATGTGFIFNTGSYGSGTERMRINSSGNVLVATTSSIPNGLGYNCRLVVQTAAGFAGLHLAAHQTTITTVGSFSNPNGQVGSITLSGSATAYNTSSDYRLKENVEPIQGAADIIKSMRPVTYNFKADSTDWHDGFLAHELQELHPRAVTGSKDAMRDEEYEVTPAVLDDEGNVVTEAVMGTRSVPDYQGVDYSKLTPILTAALQEALNKIDALEARVAALEP